MLCDICGKKPARIIITEIRNGEKREQHLCEDCAANNSSIKIAAPNLPGDINLNIGNLLSFALNNVHNAQKTANIGAIDALACPNCKETFGEFKKTGMFGCEHCYTAFNSLLPVTLKNLQSAEIHVGKVPVRLSKIKDLEYKDRTAEETERSGAEGAEAPGIRVKKASSEKKSGEEKKDTASKPAKTPKQPKVSEIEKLRLRLKNAIEIENYEEAAKLRDLIKTLEKKEGKKS